MRHVLVKDGIVVGAQMLDLETEGGQAWFKHNADEYDLIAPHETGDVGDIYDELEG